jgi:hypothetical protein
MKFRARATEPPPYGGGMATANSEVATILTTGTFRNALGSGIMDRFPKRTIPYLKKATPLPYREAWATKE